MSNQRPRDMPTAPDLPTLLLDRYRVEAALGRGAFGDVIRAFDTRIRRTVAIKTLRPSLAVRYPDQFADLRERFVREAEAASRMGIHPHIVAVHDLAADADNTLFLILEYLPGGTLADRVTRGIVPAPEALRLIADAARGLDAAHRHGIVHRDVKPANLFLTAEGRVKVGDFGVAQIDDVSQRSRLSTQHPGTPLYMSPEQTRETGYLGPESDEYALGLVLFEVLTGRAYKRLERGVALSMLQPQAHPVAALMERMTAEMPEMRYPSLGAVAEAIAAMLPEVDWLEHGVTQVVPPVPPEEPRRVNRRSVLVGIGGVVVAGGVAAGVWAKWHTDGGGLAIVPATVAPSLAPATPTATATVASGVVPTTVVVTLPPTSVPPTISPTVSPTAPPSRPPSTAGPTALPSTTPTAEGITVTPIAIIIPATGSHDSFMLGNTGRATVTLTYSEKHPEFDVDPASVTLLPNERATINVTVNRAQLAPGGRNVFAVTFVSANRMSVNCRLLIEV